MLDWDIIGSLDSTSIRHSVQVSLIVGSIFFILCFGISDTAFGALFPRSTSFIVFLNGKDSHNSSIRFSGLPFNTAKVVHEVCGEIYSQVEYI